MAAMNRRRFLGSTLGGGSAALGLSALGYRRVLGAEDRVRLACVGLGHWGQILANRLQGMKGCEIAAFCEVDRRRLEEQARKINPRAETETDLRRLLDKRKDVDAVVLATPTHWNTLAAVWACQAGKDVYVEAPFSHNVVEALTLRETARKTNRVVQTGTQLRSHTGLGELKSQLGAIGKPSVVHVHVQWGRTRPAPQENQPVPAYLDFGQWLGPAPERPFNPARLHGSWRWFWDYGTGILGDRGVHLLDLVSWLLDLTLQQKRVLLSSSGEVFNRDTAGDAPDTQLASFQCGEVTVLWEHHSWQPRRQGPWFTIRVHGSEGSLFLDDRGWEVRERFVSVPPGEARPEENEGRHKLEGLFSPQSHLENFFDCIRTRRRPSGDVGTTMDGMLLCHLGNIVLRAREKTRHFFDTERMKFPNSAELTSLLRREYRRGFTLEG